MIPTTTHDERAIHSGARLRLRLLGRCELVDRDAGTVPIGLTSQRMLALLALHHGGTRRDTAAAWLWPESTPARGQANLRAVLFRTLDRSADVVVANKTDVRLGPDVDVDLAEASTGAAAFLARSDQEGFLTDRLRQAVRLDLLPEWPDEDWLGPERDRWRELRLNCLEADAAQLTAAGQYGAAVDALLTALQTDAYRESAHARLVQVYLAQGNRRTAIKHALAYRSRLWDQLNLNPPTWLEELLPVGGGAGAAGERRAVAPAVAGRSRRPSASHPGAPLGSPCCCGGTTCGSAASRTAS